MGHWIDVMRAIKNADVILLILDARMPELSRNKDLEKKLKESGKEFLAVFNKIDLVSEETLNKLKKENPSAFFVSVVSKKGFAQMIHQCCLIAVLNRLICRFVRKHMPVPRAGFLLFFLNFLEIKN